MSNWRIVKIEQKSMCDQGWIADAKIETLGVYYLVDTSRHVHICSLTPSLEMWPMNAYATFATDEAADLDEGETEMEMLSSEEACSYVDASDLCRWPSEPVSNVPERDEDDTDEEYYLRVVEHMREHLCGNPVWF